MRVRLSPAFDGGAWCAPLAPGWAALAEPNVGLAGALRLFETQLGLGGVEATFSARVVAVAAQASAVPGAFFAASFDVDAIGTARRLLEARDELVLAGLDPSDQRAAWPPRVRALLQATAGVPEGPADRLRAVAALLERIDAHGAPRVALGIDRIDIDEDGELPHLWRRVLAASRAHGVVTQALAPVFAPVATDAACDLGGARAAPFSPRADGSLVLLRPETVEHAADDVAAALAAHDAPTAIIAADSTLDIALARRGAATVGAPGAEGDDELLEVLPLVLSVGLGPRDPALVLDLLSLTLGVLPRALSSPLLHVLSRTPSTHGTAFSQALDEAVERLPAERRQRLRARALDVLREDDVVGGARLTDVARRVRLVKAWLAGRVARGGEREEARVASALTQASILEQMLEMFSARGAERVPLEQLQRFVDEATRRAPRAAHEPARAGVVSVQDPAALVAPIERVVWWGFTRASAELPRAALAWTRPEREALAALGVHLPDRSAQTRARARSHARPLLCAARQLVLVCPRVDRRGEELHPHPLWDEIAARAAGVRGAAHALVESRLTRLWAPPRVPVAPRALPIARDRWPVPVPVVRKLESPTSMERLLGCPLHFVLDTWGVKRRTVTTLHEGSKLFGVVAHDVLARTFRARPASPADAERLARAAFADVVTEQADTYLLPRAALRRRAAEEAVARAASELARWLERNERAVVAVEERIAIERGDRTMAGTPDLVVGPPPVVIDFKTGSERLHEDKLAFGTAVQLAYYSYLLRERDRKTGEDAPWPQAAYFQIGSTRMLAVLDGPKLRETELVRGEPPATTLGRVREQAQAAFDAIAAGSALAPGAFGDAELPDGVVPPPCRFCPHDLLCGRALRDRSGT